MSDRTEVGFDYTGIFDKITAVNDKRIICLYGGSSSSKTVSALQYLTMWAEASKKPLVLTVIGESVPVIKKSVFRDWQRLVMGAKFDMERYSKMDNTYYFPNGSLLQFIPADDEMRFFSMRHDMVLIDEAYNVHKGIFDQVEIRTRQQILLTWNPVAPFWATKLEDERTDVAVIHATYHDNPFLEQNIIDALEMRANIDPNFYRVFVLGEYGTLEGLIFQEGQNWFKCTEMPEVAKRRIFVVDYGFTVDPAAILELMYSDGQFWVDELEYKPGMFNKDIHDVVKLRCLTEEQQEAGIASHDQLRKIKLRDEVITDSAEPKSNAELRGYGLNVIPSVKGADSVNFGIKAMQGVRINITTRSINTVKEFRNYAWAKDRIGELTGKPVDNWNHSIDAIRYGITHILRKPNFGTYAVT